MGTYLVYYITLYNIHVTDLLQRQEHRDSMVTPLESPRAVIGKNVLGEVDIDRKRTLLPSWTSTVRDNWGTPSGGTLGADEWRTLCFIHLVVTLIRIWGYEYEETSRHFQMLLNYLDLVHALHVLYLHETSSPLQEYYCSRMLRYLHTVITLFPDIQLKPNHHYAIHATEDLKLMGPPHARSTPVFERVNLKLRETNTNKHLGQLEFFILRRSFHSVFCFRIGRRRDNVEFLLSSG